MAVRSDDVRFGILGTGVSGGTQGVPGTPGVLISTTELKSAFASKPYFTEDLNASTNNVDALYVVNNGSDSNYVCYVPKAKANQSKITSLMCLTGFDPIGGHGVATHLLSVGQAQGANTCAVPADWSAANLVPGSYNAYFICVPQGQVNF
jgi:hypothetical protein